MSTSEVWDWAHQGDDTPEVVLDPTRVAAILVVHRAARWLARSLVALGRLDQRPGRVVAVHHGDDAECAALLEKALGEGLLDEVRHAPDDQTPGQAWSLVEVELDEGVEWLWLLHDDTEPQRDSLRQLCRVAVAEPAPDLVFPKLLEPQRRNHPDRLAEFGQTISTSGGRVVSVEPGELDQHQLEGGRVLGGSSAGLFVRRSAWRQLGGMDPAYPLHRDALDLGWRANQAGLRVVTCPGAAVHHRRSGRLGERDAALEDSPEVTDRLLGMRLVAAHSPRPRLTVLRMVLTGLFAALGLLLAKNPALAADRLRAGHQMWRTRHEVPALRERALRAGDADVRELLPSRTSLVLGSLDRAAAAVSSRLRQDPDDDTSLDDLIGDDYSGSRRGAGRAHPIGVLLACLVLLALLAGRRMVGAGALTAPQLLPAPNDLSSAWRAWLAPAPGSRGTGAPWLAGQALGATITLGHPGWFALLQQVVAVPLAALAAVPVLRRLRGGVDAGTSLLAAAWGLALPVVGIAGRGNPGSLQLAVALPLAGWAWLRWWQAERSGADRWRDPALYALFVVWLAGVVPLWWLVALLASVPIVLRQRHWPALLVPLLGPPLALAGWLPHLAQHPARLLTGADPLALASPTPQAWWGLLGLPLLPAPSTPSWLPWTLAATLVGSLAALALLLVRRTADRVTAGLSAALLVGLVLAALAARPLWHIAGAPVRADADSWTLLSVGLLLVLVARHRERWPAGVPGRALSGLSVLVLALAAGWWAQQAPGARPTSASVPGHVTAIQRSERHTRALLVDRSGDATSWQLTSADRPSWGTAEQPLPDEAMRIRVTALAGQLASGGSDQLAEEAARLGIAHLWLRGADADLVSTISNSPGLGPAETSEGATSWTVTGLVSDAQLVLPDGTVTPVLQGHVPDGTADRRLVLAAAPDNRWRATLAGRALTPTTTTDGRQAFVVPAGSGRVTWSLRPAWGALAVQGLAIATLLVLAAPSNSSTPVRAPRRGRKEA